MGCCGTSTRVGSRFSQKVTEALLTVANVVAAASRSGKLTVDKSVVEKRLDTCKTCPHLQGPRCQVCGCILAVKAGLNGATCPLRKW